LKRFLFADLERLEIVANNTQFFFEFNDFAVQRKIKQINIYGIRLNDNNNDTVGAQTNNNQTKATGSAFDANRLVIIIFPIARL